MIVLKHSPDYGFWFWLNTETNETSQPFESQEGAVKARKDGMLEWTE
jgi:hypothetical protein